MIVELGKHPGLEIHDLGSHVVIQKGTAAACKIFFDDDGAHKARGITTDALAAVVEHRCGKNQAARAYITMCRQALRKPSEQKEFLKQATAEEALPDSVIKYIRKLLGDSEKPEEEPPKPVSRETKQSSPAKPTTTHAEKTTRLSGLAKTIRKKIAKAKKSNGDK